MPNSPSVRSLISRNSPRMTGRIRSRTLLLLRWLEAAGQLTAVLVVYLGFEYDLPIFWCLGIIGIYAALNVVVSFRYPATKRLGDNEATAYLAYDLIQLAALLWLTGGLENPFALLFLAPVVVSATTLLLRNTLILGGLALICITFLAFTHQPLPWYSAQSYELDPLYVSGIWVALVVGLVFTTVYAWRIAIEARNMSDALAAAQSVLEKEHRLSALGGLAAAAAHELGTPLATIATVAKELKRELPADGHLAEDVALLGSEVDRCREILSQLAERPDQSDEHLSKMRMDALLEEISEPYSGVDVTVNIDVSPSGQKAIEVQRLPEILHGLTSLIENATDFAREKVRVRARWTNYEVMITITDDGPGFATEIIDRLGEPYVTSRPRRPAGEDRDENQDRSEHEGMGLGFFIAKTLLERTGAELTFANRKSGGARVHIVWPREAIEAS